MLFNSYIFIFAFLPLTLAGYFALCRFAPHRWAKRFLLLASLFFYSWWNVMYLPIILSSILVNYAVGRSLGAPDTRLDKKMLLFLGCTFNVLLIGFFKYADFVITNVNFVTGADIGLLHMALPLAISFFTFQQISYLVDSYRGQTKEYDFFEYSLFVSFFPQLIAGPIVHHKEMMPQFAQAGHSRINLDNISKGVFIFCIGLFKKVVVADSFALWSTDGFDVAQVLSFAEAWITSLSYTFQLYYDFSGYTDMAMGAALLFNISLPVNFNSPYKALSIQDFWRRWHMTLSRFLRDYIYFPLGGSRVGHARIYVNIMITFLIGGIWHGAGWTFVFWGGLHGVALCVHRAWQTLGLRMPRLLAWFVTFNFVNIAWVFFRATSFADAIKVLRGMFGLNGVFMPGFVQKLMPFLADLGVQFGNTFVHLKLEQRGLFGMLQALPVYQGVACVGLTFLTFCSISQFAKNSQEQLGRFQPRYGNALFAAFLFTVGLLHMRTTGEFLYFNF